MHNGSFQKLSTVIRFYNKGGENGIGHVVVYVNHTTYDKYS